MLAGAALLPVIASCSLLDQARQTASAPDMPGDAAARTGVYVEHCLNHGVFRLDEFLADYAAAAPADFTAVSPEQADALELLFAPSRSETCDEAIDTIGDSTDSADVAARALGESFDAVYPLIEDAVRYYSRGDHRDDDFAEGAAIDEELDAAVATYLDAREAFVEEVDAITAAQSAEALEKISNGAADLPTLLAATMTHAESAIDALADETGAVRASADFGSVDVEAFAAAVDATVEMWDRALDRAATTDEDDEYFTFDMFETSMEETIAGLLDLNRRLASDTPFTDEELVEISESTGFLLEFGFEHQLELYNTLVDRYNGLGW